MPWDNLTDLNIWVVWGFQSPLEAGPVEINFYRFNMPFSNEKFIYVHICEFFEWEKGFFQILSWLIKADFFFFKLKLELRALKAVLKKHSFAIKKTPATQKIKKPNPTTKKPCGLLPFFQLSLSFLPPLSPFSSINTTDLCPSSLCPSPFFFFLRHRISLCSLYSW